MPRKKTLQEFIDQSKEIHGDKYDYSMVVYKNDSTKVDLICNTHGVFSIRPGAHLKQQQGCKQCGYETLSKNNSMSHETFMERIEEMYGDKYEILSPYQGAHEYIDVRCKVHDSIYQVKPYLILSGRECRQCGLEKRSKKVVENSSDAFIDACLAVHGHTYDLSAIEYKGSKEPIRVICYEHGDFYPTPNNFVDKKSGCPKCANNGTSVIESRLISALETYVNPSSITHRHKIYKGDDLREYKEIDVLVGNVAVEINGVYWHSDKFKESHSDVHDIIVKNGYKPFIVTDMELEYNFNLCLSMILNRMGLHHERIYARKCELRELNTSETNLFIQANHLQGSTKTYYKSYGLIHNENIVSLMTFGKPRFSKKADWELLRFCSKKHVNVVGGASRLLAAFRKENIGSIISYANRRWSTGDLYDKMGFKHVDTSPPSYDWWHPNGRKVSRYQSMKHKLSKVIGEHRFDANLTEVENMRSAGYFRVFDAGNEVYMLE